MTEGIDRRRQLRWLDERHVHTPAALQQLLGPLPVRRRLPPRGDRPRSAGLRLHPGLAALVDRGVRATVRRPARLLLPVVTGPFDVCVVGGGPAGAGLAAALARTGYRVCVVEQRVFPRDHVGESLSPGAWPLLDSLGIARSAVEAVAAPVRVTGVRWRTEREERVPVGAGLTLDRGRFDALLLDHARASGATVRLGRARPATRTATGWRVPIDAGPVEARFLADASGRHDSSAVGGAGPPRGPWPCTPGGGTTRGPAGTADAWSHALAEGWLWCARLPDGEVRAMVFVDPDRLRAEAAGPGRLFRRLVSGSERGAELLAGYRALLRSRSATPAAIASTRW